MSKDRKYFAGLDLGGTFLKFALGNPDEGMLVKKQIPSKADQSQDAIFEVIFSAITDLQNCAKERGGELVAVGVGSPGAIHFKECRLLGSTPNLPEWTNAPIRERIQGRFGIPVWADNDGNMMAFGESRQGAAKGCQHVLCATLGTGIGGGILINGSLYRGSHYAGSEIGHLSVVHNGRLCNCGGQGCFEQYASATAMIRRYRERMFELNQPAPESGGTKLIFDRAEQGEAIAREIIAETVDYLGSGFASLVNIFNPQVLVIGGGVAEAGDDFIARVERAVHGKAMKPVLEGLKVVRAVLGNDAGCIGAFHLAAEMYEMSK